MLEIENLLKKEIPCAVMQYFGTMKENKMKKYELIYIDENKNLQYELLDIKGKSFFKNNRNKFRVEVENINGCVFEFKKFKEYKEKLIGKGLNESDYLED